MFEQTFKNIDDVLWIEAGCFFHLYEAKIKSISNAGRSAGNYYTPRPLICTMI